MWEIKKIDEDTYLLYKERKIRDIKLGNELPTPPQPVRVMSQQPKIKRPRKKANKMNYKWWSREDVKTLKDLVALDYSYREIAKRLGRSTESVQIKHKRTQGKRY